MTTQVPDVLVSSPVIHRHPGNPILTYRDVPYPSALVFNAGVTKYQGRYVMVFRNDYGDFEAQRLDGTNLGLAFSDDGLNWQVAPEPCFRGAVTWLSASLRPGDFLRAYDPRLTVIDGRCYMTFAIDTQHGVRGGIAVTDDFESWQILSTTVPDNRNLALFPERVGGRFVRLERPMPVYGRHWQERFDVWLSTSADLWAWADPSLLLAVEDVPFADRKIGPAAPPVKTSKGWLTTFHAVDVDPERGKNGWELQWQKRYTAGIMLLDLEDPTNILGLYKAPLMAPTALYEASGGFRNNVIFPGGMVLEDTGEVKFYYGAADTVMCLAIAAVDDLLKLCLEG
ncbi:MAG: glycoside hydrolase family 130 protein [Anaerolineae bacterium]|nr:glycoside hydrolase family 130 protein [Anaerolineae bacterium]